MFRGIAFLSLALTMPIRAQHANTTLSNPYGTLEDTLAGGVAFRSQCAGCHGRDGSGASAPDLTTGIFKHGGTDDALFQSIAKGVPGTPMPAFDLRPPEIWQIVAFVRSLSDGRAANRSKGNAMRGAEVFRTAGCIRCHTAAGEGGTMGPDLSQIGLLRSLAHLESSVLRPAEQVSSEYWSVRGRTKSGQPLSGIRLNEDTWSFQIRDSGGRLRSVLKEDLAEFELIRSSPMPAFEGKLKGAAFDDLIAYLATLRGSRGEVK